MSPLLAVIGLSLIGGLLSLVGALLLVSKKMVSMTFLDRLVAFAAGTFIGAATLDILPEAIELASKTEFPFDQLSLLVAVGIVGFFLIERYFLRFHSHGHEHGHHPELRKKTTPTLLILGDSLHNFLDGVAITVTYLANPALGLTTALAVAAHEIPSEVGEASVGLRAGWPKDRVLRWNVCSSLTATLGAILAYWLRDTFQPIMAPLLALTAGVFLYIALSDLLPELHHPTNGEKGGRTTLAFLLGILLVGFLARYLEGAIT